MVKRKVRRDNPDSMDNFDKNALYMYMQEISKVSLLSKAEEEEVARMAAKGNLEARNRLINANLRFVISVAKKYQGMGLPLEDLISEGNMGLINAVKNFDVDKGFRFISYAVWWIRQSIIKAINEKGRMIRLPFNKANDLTRIKKTRQVMQIESDGNNDHDIREIAKFLDMPHEKAESLIQICQEISYLDDHSSKYRNSPALKDLIEDKYSKTPFEQTLNNVLRDELETAVNGLEQRASDVIRGRFGLGDSGPMTLNELGETYNLSKERVRQIERRALGKLQQSSQRKILESYITA